MVLAAAVTNAGAPRRQRWPLAGVARPGHGLRLAALALLAVTVPAVPAAGIPELAAAVDRACGCAAAQPSGMDAALLCTDGTRDFGRVKVAHRDGWSAREQQQAHDLERVIETCIANALDLESARERLGLGPEPATPLARWRRIAAAELPDHAERLVRLQRAGGAPPLMGMMQEVSGGSVMLRLARRDGGGSERVAVDAILGAWVLDLGEP